MDAHAWLSHCRWPELAEPYATALREAVAFSVARFAPLGLIASGTIIQGQPHPASDLDLYVIHAPLWRQRLQRFFHGVPAELFVNPPRLVERYLSQEQHEGRPITAHLLSTGFVVLDRDPVIGQLRDRADRILAAHPDPTPERLLNLRYFAATLYEDATDIAGDDPASALLILGQALPLMLEYAYLAANHYVPRHKEWLAALTEFDPALAALTREFYTAGDAASRLAAAEALAGRTIGVRGFFEWESTPEEVV